MKTLHLLAWICAVVPIAAAAPDQSPWKWQQDVGVPAPGVTRLELSPATLDASQATLADLRLIAPDGVETPWLLKKAIPPVVKNVATTDFKATLEGPSTVLSASHKAGGIEAVTLQSPARDFLKSARVDGSRDGATWTPLTTAELVFRHAGGASRLQIPIPPGVWSHLRVTLDDDRSPPVVFTGLLVTPVKARTETLDHPLTIRKRTEELHESHLVLDLGAKNLHLADLKLDAPDGVFSRSCRVSIEGNAIGSAVVYQYIAENRASATSLVIPLHQRIPTDRLTLVIANGDSPPLNVRGVSATRYPDRLLFHANQPGPWKLLTGNRHANGPHYDLGSLRDELNRASAASITPGPLTANPDYQPPPALPDVQPAGNEIDLTDWGRRRTVHATLPGIVGIELDAVTLSHVSRVDLGDLRLVQDGRQIPWLREAKPRLVPLAPQVTEAPDPKRPTVSRWKITTPHPGLPLDQIEIRSSDPLFTRDLRFLQHGKDELGNPWNRTLTTKTWTQTPGDHGSLTAPLGDVRIDDALWIETDNGDNPPIRLGGVTLLYRAPSVIAKISHDAPLFLYYDNPQATPPVYDLNLVRAELLTADRQTATLGEEELLKPGEKRDTRELNAGSPWLWVALALVVIALLFIVAKLLPNPTLQDERSGSPD